MQAGIVYKAEGLDLGIDVQLGRGGEDAAVAAPGGGAAAVFYPGGHQVCVCVGSSGWEKPTRGFSLVGRSRLGAFLWLGEAD